MSRMSRVYVLMIVVLGARAAMAQNLEASGWAPIGPAPAEADSGGRGYVVADDTSDVLDPGVSEVSLDSGIANYFYLDNSRDVSISQRFETHTLALDYRRGVKLHKGPRLEWGAQLQVHESDGGILNGFITTFEDLVHASLRSKLAVPPPPGMSIIQNDRVVYQAPANSRGFGDVSLVVKAPLRDRDVRSRATRVAVRVSANVRGASTFTAGNFIGSGISIDQKRF